MKECLEPGGTPPCSSRHSFLNQHFLQRQQAASNREATSSQECLMQSARRLMEGRHWKKHASFFFKKNIEFTSYSKLIAWGAINFPYI